MQNMTAFDEISLTIRDSKTCFVVLQGVLAGLFYSVLFLVLCLIYFLFNEIIMETDINIGKIIDIIAFSIPMTLKALPLIVFFVCQGAVNGLAHKICSNKGWEFETNFGRGVSRQYSSALWVSAVSGPLNAVLMAAAFAININIILMLFPFIGFLFYILWERRFYRIVMKMQMYKEKKTGKGIKTSSVDNNA